MNYLKPTIDVLGKASEVIEGVGKGVGEPDSPDPDITPAYDLDE